MFEPVSIGRVTVLPVQDAPLTGSRSFMFPPVTEEQWEPWRHYFNPRGNLPLNVGTFLVRSGDRTILVDTGVGDKPRQGFRPGSLLANLAEGGVKPEDVDLVVITHLHVDHVGWNTVWRDGALVPTFLNARYLVARTEWDYFTEPERAASMEYIRDSVLPLEGAGQLDLVDDEHRVTSELTLVPAPGHTPGHVCVAIVSGAARGLIIGDLAHHPVQLTEVTWNTVMDLNPEKAAETRARLVERMERENAVTMGNHFPPPGVGRLVRLGERRLWQAL